MGDVNRRVNYVEKMKSSILDHYCNVEWRIEKFSKYYRDVYSDAITPYCDCRTKWRIYINFLHDYIDIGFERCDDATDFVKGKFRLSIENTVGQVYYDATSNSSGKLFRVVRPSVIEQNGFKLLEDDVLVIKGSIDLSGCCIKTTSFVGFS
ncbi:uncharacterized protein CEXT_21671 [Caerostris extrusa]|uniref:Uncharacterized protein n=1 Tax=Caerostris extrusa TaxID=172846 RepID=A0AAV4XVV1_CAEEX|nr:uncharacterized protein CEXT_21671 [Caerostris extrusa]